MKKDIKKARRDFRDQCVCKNGLIKPEYRKIVAKIYNYSGPLNFLWWRQHGRYRTLQGTGSQYNAKELMDIMGVEYKMVNVSCSGRAKDGEAFELTPKGLKRAQAILKDYNTDYQ